MTIPVKFISVEKTIFIKCVNEARRNRKHLSALLHSLCIELGDPPPKWWNKLVAFPDLLHLELNCARSDFRYLKHIFHKLDLMWPFIGTVSRVVWCLNTIPSSRLAIHHSAWSAAVLALHQTPGCIFKLFSPRSGPRSRTSREKAGYSTRTHMIHMSITNDKRNYQSFHKQCFSKGEVKSKTSTAEEKVLTVKILDPVRSKAMQ